jgi:hypothetical protein
MCTAAGNRFPRNTFAPIVSRPAGGAGAGRSQDLGRIARVMKGSGTERH